MIQINEEDPWWLKTCRFFRSWKYTLGHKSFLLLIIYSSNLLIRTNKWTPKPWTDIQVFVWREKKNQCGLLWSDWGGKGVRPCNSCLICAISERLFGVVRQLEQCYIPVNKWHIYIYIDHNSNKKIMNLIV